MKPAVQVAKPQPVKTFSILERIVGVETKAVVRFVRTGYCLSVSSNGSLGLKPFAIIPAVRLIVTFSILERIVGVETDELVDVEYTLHLFQYPRTDRWG